MSYRRHMATATGPDEELMTLGDIAVLAQVQRPVVTMWRGRPHRDAGPFPAPARHVRGQARFTRAEVVAWLERSGRGNNREVGADAALHARPPVPTPAGAALAEALLVVAAASGEHLPGLDRDDLLDLADACDPDDRVAFREIESAADGELLATAAYVDALLGAAHGPHEALAHLRRDPSWFGRSADPSVPAPEVVHLVGALAQALADPLRPLGRVPIADPTGCAADLVLGALAASDVEGADGPLARPISAGDDAERVSAIRECWRTLTTQGASPEPIDVDDEGHIDIPTTAVVVARYPHPGAPTLRPERLLEEVDDVLLQLRPDQRAVVLGPAAVLTDALAGDVESARRKILDTGRLRALVRLGPGTAPAAPQRRLALWVFGSAPEGNFRQGRTAVADLAGLDLAQVRDDLVVDVLAAVEDRPLPESAGADESQGRAHVFRVARYQRTFAVLARTGDLVPRDLRADLRPGREPGQAGVAGLIDDVASPLPGVVMRTVPLPGRAQGRSVTVRELLDARRVQLIAGTRLTAEETRSAGEATGGLAVVGVPELCGRVRRGSRVVDLLPFTAAHPHAVRTEAGDVVFCVGSSRGAWVDLRGGTVVEAPARALRVLPADHSPDLVNPHVLAADLMRGIGAQWRAFPARLLPKKTPSHRAADAMHPAATAESTDTLADVLDVLAHAREQAQQRADALADLADQLAAAAVDGGLTAMMDSTEPEGH